MYLLLDIGNSRTKAVIYENGKFTLLSDLNLQSIAPYRFIAVYVACVGFDEHVEQLQHTLGLTHLPWYRLVSQTAAFGVVNRYATPERLGVDRWLAILGADSLLQTKNLMIVDAGTALTIDWLDKSQQHQGGWIIPGLRLQQEAVIKNTARVGSTPDDSQELILGVNTQDCVKNGALAALCGAIRAGWQLKPTDVIFLTGGDSPKLAQYLSDLPVQLDPLLIFRGIARYIAT
ncbi:type III pantothenate kinase [Alishewanella sp. 16-MA]|uniref:Type III pantothenate kinase n=1 Tax=Alishewanella maricola TaxID=2795740 RepID=A0ABS8C7H9_9ALTE|nr:type III pantothenate kinase [Alishewanella maricola]MCB5228289.1 type III pantothenate kinase [Alishewanella maricola]